MNIDSKGSMLINKNSSSKFLKRFNAKINFDLIDNNGRFK